MQVMERVLKMYLGRDVSVKVRAREISGELIAVDRLCVVLLEQNYGGSKVHLVMKSAIEEIELPYDPRISELGGGHEDYRHTE